MIEFFMMIILLFIFFQQNIIIKKLRNGIIDERSLKIDRILWTVDFYNGVRQEGQTWGKTLKAHFYNGWLRV